MNILTNQTVFQCEHCNKRYQRRHSCESHEAFCGKNPANQHACFSCIFLIKTQTKPDKRTFTHFTCEKLAMGMYSYKAIKRNVPGLERLSLMPKNCKEHRLPVGAFQDEPDWA